MNVRTGTSANGAHSLRPLGHRLLCKSYRPGAICSDFVNIPERVAVVELSHVLGIYVSFAAAMQIANNKPSAKIQKGVDFSGIEATGDLDTELYVRATFI